MLKLLSVRSVILFSGLVFTASVVIAATSDRAKANKVEDNSEPKNLIVVKNNTDKNNGNVSMTDASYNKESGFIKDYTVLDNQMLMQSSIIRNRDNAVGKVYIPKSFEEASRLAELRHGIEKNKGRVGVASSEVNGDKVKKSVVPAQNKEGISFLASVVYHSNGKSDLTGGDLQSLKEVAKFVKEKSAHVLIVGHASSRTTDMSMLDHKLVNYDVSVRRVNKIKDELLKNGLSASDISLSAVSDTEPIKNEVMPMSENVNRRSEIYISY